jgi:hypothetical protein
MRKLITPIFFLLLISCQNKYNDEKILIDNQSLIKEISLNEDINVFVSNFIKSVDDANCIYELYFDKKTEEEYFITVFSKASDLDYFTKYSPLNYTILDDKCIFIYTGLEGFIDKNYYQSKSDFKIFHLGNKDSKDVSKTCSMVIKKDTIYTVGAIGLPFTDVNFLPPIHVAED